MRLMILGCGALLCAVTLAGGASAETAATLPPNGAPASAGDPAPKTKDLLGDMEVTATATGRPLPKIGVLPSISAEIEDVTLRSVVRRDLDLCGEFEVLDDSAAPEGLYLEGDAVDTKAWGKKGVEAVVRVSAKKSGDKVELLGQAFLVKEGDKPVFERKATVTGPVRVASHRMADALIGALTGTNGGFASRLAFVATIAKVRRAYVMDSDGNGARGISKDDEVALSPVFGKGEELFYASSKGNAEYRLVSEAGQAAALPVKGSVYGVAYSKDRTKVAVSVGVGASIKLYAGADFLRLSEASSAPFAMEPAFSPGGKLAFVGMSERGQRVYVDGKAVTPEGAYATGPTFCDHPDGVRLVFGAGAGVESDLFSTGEQGGSIVRLTQGQGKNSAPACSPDGRLVAFFSTRTSGEGPGLYLMRSDGLRAKRISTLLGDSLVWAALPPEKDGAPSAAK